MERNHENQAKRESTSMSETEKDVLSLLEDNLNVLVAMAGIEAQWALFRLQERLGLDVEVSKIQSQMELLLELLETVAPSTGADILAPLREQIEETAELLARKVTVEEGSLEPPVVSDALGNSIQEISDATPQEESKIELLQRVTATSDNDSWGILAQLDQLLEQYSRHSHLLLPAFWAEASHELHRYSSTDIPQLDEVARLPAGEMDTIVRRLLKEAPAARLLQYIRRKRVDAGVDLERDQTLTYDEVHTVRTVVREFFEEINQNMDHSGKIIGQGEEWKQRAAEAERDFDLGPAEIESRIAKMVQNQLRRFAEPLFSDDANINSLEFLVRAQTVVLISRLNKMSLELPRLRQVLAEMKS